MQSSSSSSVIVQKVESDRQVRPASVQYVLKHRWKPNTLYHCQKPMHYIP